MNTRTEQMTTRQAGQATRPVLSISEHQNPNQPMNKTTSIAKLLIALLAVLALAIGHAPAAQLVTLQQPTATYSQSGYGVATAIDGISDYPFPVDGGWAVLSGLGTTNEVAVFETASDIGFPGGTRLFFTLIQTHWNPGHTLGRFRLSVTADPRADFADGLSFGGDVTANWTALEPGVMSSTNGTVLTKLPDQSILASGTTPATDTYTIEAVTSLTNITGIRIEAMEDSSLPFNGPGRWPNNGNFVISELELRASAVNIYWTNTLGGNWNDAANWSPNQVPGFTNNVFIAADGTYTVVGLGEFSTLFVGAASGTQTVSALGGGNVVLNGPIVFATNTVFDLNATVYGGAGATITVFGQMNWVAGLLNEPVSLTIAPNALLNISGASKDLNASLTNAGTVVWTGGDIRMSYYPGGAIYNQSGGVFDVQCDQGILFQRFPAQFVNAGLFRKSASSGATWFDAVPFYNTGRVDVQSGTLDLRNGLSQSAGAIFLSGGNLANVTTIQAGSLEGAGHVLGNLAMSGKISPGFSAGRLEVLGNYTQTASGSYHLEIGGTIAGTNYDQVVITNNAALAGAINVCSLNGFVPALGDRFEIMKFASMSGGVSFSGLNIANGVRLEPVISSTNIVLVATNAPFDATGIYWTNTLGGNWTDAVNWSPNQVPGPADQAYIIQDGTYTVSIYGVSVSNLIVGASCGTQTVVIPFTGFFDSHSVRLHGNSQFASNTILNVGGWILWAYVVGDGQITMHGQMNLNGVQLLESVGVTIATNGVLNLSGATVLQGAITNAGRVNWVGAGNFRMDGAATINNLTSGIFDVQNDQVMSWNFRGNVVFHNQGLFRKSVGGGTTTLYLINFFNTGIVEVQSGEVRFSGYSFMQNSGTSLLNGGRLSSDVPMFFKGGLLGGSGQVEANGASVMVSGQFSPGFSAGQVEVQGNYIQKPSGSFNVEIGGTIAGTNYDQIIVTSNASLAGAINVCSINGFTPAPGDQFEIMRFGSMSGSVNFQGLDVAQGIYLQPVISSTNIVLVATSVPNNPAPRMHLARNGDSLWLWWPLGYGGFNVESTTNLNAPVAWSPVTPAEVNRHTFQSAEPMKLFRMIQP